MIANLIHSILIVASIPTIFSLFYLATRGISLYIQSRKEKQNKKTMQQYIDTLIAQTKGKFFSITFEKKDGTRRTINGKDRYIRLVKGNANHPATQGLKAAGYKSAVDRNREGWFSFQPEKVVEFKCGAIHKKFSSVTFSDVVI
jgi:hypothetical protein